MSARRTTKSPSGTKLILFLVAAAFLVWAAASGAALALGQAFAGWLVGVVIS